MKTAESSKRGAGRLKTKKYKEIGFLISLVAIPLVNFCIFWLYINIQTVVMTFQRYNVATGQYEWIWFERYGEVFSDYIFGGNRAAFNTFTNSLKAIGINLVILPLAFVCAYSFYKKIRFQKFFRVLFMFPSMISLVVLTMCYRYMFSYDFGPVSALLAQIMGHKVSWLGSDSDYLWALIWIFCIWAGMGTNVIMMSGAMMRIPADLTDSCKVDGLGFWHEMVSIVLPLVMPTVAIYCISILASPLSFVMQPMMIAPNEGTENKFLTIPWYVFAVTSSGAGQDDMLNAATIGISLSVVLLPFIIGVRVITNKFTPKVSF